MKRKTNISVRNAQGYHVTSNMELGPDNGYTSGDILDANATTELVKEKVGDISGKANIADLATVATSGSYSDLSGTPTIPSNLSDLNNDLGFTSDVYTKQQINDIVDLLGVGYGIRWTSENTTPYRIGNTSMHKTLPIQSMMRRCMVEDNGTVHGYIDPTDYTKYIDGTTVDYTGAHGQYCVEIPEYWYSGIVESGSQTVFDIVIYPVPVTGAKHSKKCYVGAVEASTNDASSESTKKLFSICTAEIVYSDGDVNASDISTYSTGASDFIGGNRSTSYTGVKSLLGRPATNLTRAQFRTKAAARGTGWSQQYWEAYMSWVRLYVVEYCNFNTQAAYNSSKTLDGYMQGGLGAGVTTASSSEWNTFNSYNPFVPCGVTKRLGNNTGVVLYKFAAGEFKSTAFEVSVPSYRGIENPFGHIWKWTDGINIFVDSSTSKGSVYTCSNISNFADDTSTNYVLRTSNAEKGEGYIKNWLCDDNADFIPLTQGGSDHSYLCDYMYMNNTGWRVCCCGGRASYGAAAGLFCLHAHYDSSIALAAIGGRLYYTPQN